jgi:hypothetical protein
LLSGSPPLKKTTLISRCAAIPSIHRRNSAGSMCSLRAGSDSTKQWRQRIGHFWVREM